MDFTGVRCDGVVQVKKVVVKVRTSVVRSHGSVAIDTISARHAYLLCTITYAKQRGSVSYAIGADGSGFATLRFPVSYKPPKGERVGATVTITAEQGKDHASAEAHITVQGDG